MRLLAGGAVATGQGECLGLQTGYSNQARILKEIGEFLPMGKMPISLLSVLKSDRKMLKRNGFP